MLPLVVNSITINTSAESKTHLQDPSKKSYSSSINVENNLHIKIWKREWIIDHSKLHNGITDLIHEFQRSKQEPQMNAYEK